MNSYNCRISKVIPKNPDVASVYLPADFDGNLVRVSEAKHLEEGLEDFKQAIVGSEAFLAVTLYGNKAYHISSGNTNCSDVAWIISILNYYLNYNISHIVYDNDLEE